MYREFKLHTCTVEGVLLEKGGGRQRLGGMPPAQNWWDYSWNDPPQVLVVHQKRYQDVCSLVVTKVFFRVTFTSVGSKRLGNFFGVVFNLG